MIEYDGHLYVHLRTLCKLQHILGDGLNVYEEDTSGYIYDICARTEAKGCVNHGLWGRLRYNRVK